MLTQAELETLACGNMDLPVEEMRANCRVDEHSARRGEMLWEVLERFTPTERALFIKFGCGRFGLPPPGYSWQQPK
jgi:E3 ubiquitin-protein ligase HERC2